MLAWQNIALHVGWHYYGYLDWFSNWSVELKAAFLEGIGSSGMLPRLASRSVGVGGVSAVYSFRYLEISLDFINPEIGFG